MALLLLSVAQTWNHRARLEREATLRFARLAVQLAASNADAAIVTLARRASDDEARHAELCARVAARFAPPPDDEPPTTVREIAPRALPLRDRVLYEVVAFACVSESINVALLLRTLDVATDEGIREAVRELARDEVVHSKLGWAHLRNERAAGRGDFLGALLPKMLDGTVTDEVFGDDDPADAAALALGQLPRSMRRELLHESLDSVVIPGLESMGVDVAPARAWMTKRF